MGIFDLFKKKQEEPAWVSSMPKELAMLLLEQIKNNPQASNQDEISEGTGSFGLEASNPIPIFGVPMNEEYLSRVRAQSGEKIRWRRIGSTSAPNIFNPVDCYEIFNQAGDTIANLYLSPYHLKTSEKAPKGFKLL